MQRFLQAYVCARYMWVCGRYMWVSARYMWVCGRCMWEVCPNRSVVFLKGESYLAHLSVWTVGPSFGFAPSTEWITELTVHKTWIGPPECFLFSENSTIHKFSYFQWIVGERKMKAGLKGERWWRTEFFEWQKSEY